MRRKEDAQANRSISVPDGETSDKRAFHQGRSVAYLVVTLLFLSFPAPPRPPPILPSAMQPQDEHQQGQQHRAHHQS